MTRMICAVITTDSVVTGRTKRTRASQSMSGRPFRIASSVMMRVYWVIVPLAISVMNCVLTRPMPNRPKPPYSQARIQIPNTNVGNDHPRIAITRVAWSMSEFRRSAETVPSQMPSPMIGMMEKRASSRLAGKKRLIASTTVMLALRV